MTIVDDGTAGYMEIAGWASGTAASGYYGTGYRTHGPNGLFPDAVVVDNTDSGAVLTGTWGTSTNSPKWGAATSATAPPAAARTREVE